MPLWFQDVETGVLLIEFVVDVVHLVIQHTDSLSLESLCILVCLLDCLRRRSIVEGVQCLLGSDHGGLTALLSLKISCLWLRGHVICQSYC